MPKLINAGLLSGWLVERRLQVAKPHLLGRVLDFACGVGSLAPSCDPASYVGYDIDPRKIEIARRELPAYRFETELPDERFDTVAALAFIEHVPDPDKTLEQFTRLLNPGGRIVLTTPHPRLEWVHTVGSKVGLFSSNAHEQHEDLIDRAQMESLVAGVGMRVTVYRRFLFGANQLFVIT